MDENVTQNDQNGLTAMQQKVYGILQGNPTPAGTHRDNVLKQFPSNQHREVK